jgi:prepilin signal peptidase PulO-like enzyme (type II secretory pathway)
MAASLAKAKRKGQRKSVNILIVTFLFGAALLALLILLSWTDIKSYRLPDKLTYPLMIVGLVEGYIADATFDRLIGMTAGYLIFLTIEYGFRALRGKDGLGRGDAKLLAAGGAWCGWAGLPFIILIASGFGLLAALILSVRRSTENGRIPFGPFLAVGIFMVWTAHRYVQAIG